MNEVDYSPKRYNGNGITKEFPFDWKVFKDSDLIIKLIDSEGSEEIKELALDYTVTVEAVGGSVIFNVAPEVGKIVVIERDVSDYQSTGYSTSTGFQGSEIEKSFDRVSCNLQEMNYSIETFKTEFSYEVINKIDTNKKDTDKQIKDNKADTDRQISELSAFVDNKITQNKQELEKTQSDFEDEINSKLDKVNEASDKINNLENAVNTALNASQIASENAQIAKENADNAKENAEFVNNRLDGAIGDIQSEAKTQIDNIKQTGFYMEDGKLFYTDSDGNKREFKSGGGGVMNYGMSFYSPVDPQNVGVLKSSGQKNYKTIYPGLWDYCVGKGLLYKQYNWGSDLEATGVARYAKNGNEQYIDITRNGGCVKAELDLWKHFGDFKSNKALLCSCVVPVTQAILWEYGAPELTLFDLENIAKLYLQWGAAVNGDVIVNFEDWSGNVICQELPISSYWQNQSDNKSRVLLKFDLFFKPVKTLIAQEAPPDYITQVVVSVKKEGEREFREFYDSSSSVITPDNFDINAKCNMTIADFWGLYDKELPDEPDFEKVILKDTDMLPEKALGVRIGTYTQDIYDISSSLEDYSNVYEIMPLFEKNDKNEMVVSTTYDNPVLKNGAKWSTDTSITPYDFVVYKNEGAVVLPLLNGSEDLMSDKYDDLTLKPSGESYIAPANGWVFLRKKAGSDWYYSEIIVCKEDDKFLYSDFDADYKTSPTSPFVKVKKGQKYKVMYNATGAIEYFRFIYARGNGDLYYYVGDSVKNQGEIDLAGVLDTLAKKVDKDSINIPYTLLESRYADKPLYNASMLASVDDSFNPVYHSGDSYLAVYEGLEVEYDESIDVGQMVVLPCGANYIKRGLEVKLSTDSNITDFDFVINRSNKTFRLRLKDGSEKLPSNKIEKITLGASTFSYTAKANGWFSVLQTNSSNGQMNVHSGGRGSMMPVSVSVPVKTAIFLNRGDVVRYEYTGRNAGSSDNYCQFVYAKGNGKLYHYVGNTVQNTLPINAGQIGEALLNKADRTELDGKWVYKPFALATNLAIPVTDGNGKLYTYDLSNYLPNDDYDYEAWVSSEFNDSSFLICYARSDIFVNSTGIITKGGHPCGGSVIIPIGAERNIKLLIVNAGATQAHQWAGVKGYRRLGKSQ